MDDGRNDVVDVLGLWSSGSGALHVKLGDALRRAIDSRQLTPGTRLPSERELARRLLVSRSTVVAAYDALRAQGPLERRQGSGTRVARRAPVTPVLPVAGSPINPLYRSLLAGETEDIISLACAIQTAHPSLAGAMAAVAAEAPTTLLRFNGYLPLGLPELRAGLADLHTAEGLPTSPDQIMVTTGAQQAVQLAASLYLQPGDRVVVESPTFSGTLDALRSTATGFIPAGVDQDGVDVDQVRRALHDSRPSLVYLIPSFHNPTGASLARHRRQALAELAEATGVPLIEDNALEHNRLDVEPGLPIAAYASPGTPIITVGSFSKLVWGGLRVGWLRGPVDVVGRLGEMKACRDLGTPLFDQAVCARMLHDVHALRADRRAELKASLALVGDLLRTRLPEWSWSPPAGGPSLWIRLPHVTATAFAQVALRHGVEVIPGGAMSPAGGHHDHLRLPFTAPHDLLRSVVDRLGDAWAVYSDSALGVPATRRSVVV